MGISMITAAIIKSRTDILCTAAGPTKAEGKYVGWILLDIDRWHPLLNTEPIYDTEEAAVTAMEKTVEDIRNAEDVPGSSEEILDRM